MTQKATVDDTLSNLVGKIADAAKQKSVSFFDEDKGSASSRFNRLFGRQKPIHSLLGGGKSADLFLWRNKKISASFLTGVTAIWVLFEWLDYHFLTLVCFVVVLGMIVQFIWTNASGLINQSSRKVPRVVLPEELFVNVGRLVGNEMSRALQFLQDVSCGGNLKQFLIVVLSLWIAAIIGSWCNFITVLYIGFVAAHTLPVLYEKYEDQVDDFAYKLFGQLQKQYRKFDSGLLSKIPRGGASLKGKKLE